MKPLAVFSGRPGVAIFNVIFAAEACAQAVLSTNPAELGAEPRVCTWVSCVNALWTGVLLFGGRVNDCVVAVGAEGAEQLEQELMRSPLQYRGYLRTKALPIRFWKKLGLFRKLGRGSPRRATGSEIHDGVPGFQRNPRPAVFRSCGRNSYMLVKLFFLFR
jgi:hypothetical protein